MKPTVTTESTKKECSSQEVEWDKLEGDGLVIRMRENKGKLWISGNGCQVSLGRNSGSVRVTGDGCQLNVGLNSGSVEYDGDGGQVVLGPDSTSTRVKYRGDGGSVGTKNTTPKKKCDKQELKKNKTRTTTTCTRTVVSNGRMVVTRRNLGEGGSILSTKIVASDCGDEAGGGNGVVEMKTSLEMGLLRGINVSVTNCI